MKIKEVIEKTNLTDRAIRLYIDNALVSPGIEESYSGRKNIEFSEKDVERLSQIALLRKAGFSISDIKEIISDNGKIEEVVRKFIEETDEEIKSKTEVVEKLKDISFDEKISLEILCEKLSESVEEIKVPEEDLNAPKSLKFARKFLKIFSFVGMVVALGILIVNIILNISFYKYYVPTVATAIFTPLCLGGLIVIAVIFFNVWKLNRGTCSPKGERSADMYTSVTLSVIAVVLFIPALLVSFFFGSFSGCSRTTNPDHYLEVDEAVEDEMNIILEVFPGRIPSSARTSGGYADSTKYYYYCENSFSLNYDIVAEWVLSDKEYLQAKENAVKEKDYITKEKSEWTYLYFGYYPQREMSELGNITESGKCDYSCLAFAYNDKENKVRYIASISDDERFYQPPFDW